MVKGQHLDECRQWAAWVRVVEKVLVVVEIVSWIECSRVRRKSGTDTFLAEISSKFGVNTT